MKTVMIKNILLVMMILKKDYDKSNVVGEDIKDLGVDDHDSHDYF